ncbi:MULTISPECIES: phosphatase PAP2 family protein [Altibacter]|uniref:phosphatase PAP2 family protein n=1 Tax=Altibacter TaxID=1535231 RepID=UPI000557F900|nr:MULTISPECIES: phosphatase PAP2 family protein [Altibacter]MCW8980565.1 phosphatase PAP2 family protein [Altibacter sp.]MCW9038778.1 phosphatase PAP2 family protein [Altibacter sp.]
MFEALKEWDRKLFIFLNNLGIEQYDGFWLFVTQIESWIPLFLLIVALIFYYYKGRKGAVVFAFVLLTFAITLFITDTTKDFVARLRPNNVDTFSELIRILQKPSTFSFFSGHASSSFSITTFVVLSLRRYNHSIYLMYLWPLIFVLSRIYVGVHYPSDILVGAMVGTIMGYLFYKVSKRVLRYMDGDRSPRSLE